MAFALASSSALGVSDLWGLRSSRSVGFVAITSCSTCFGRYFDFVSLEDRFSLELLCYYRMFTGVLCNSSTGGQINARKDSKESRPDRTELLSERVKYLLNA